MKIAQERNRLCQQLLFCSIIFITIAIAILVQVHYLFTPTINPAHHQIDPSEKNVEQLNNGSTIPATPPTEEIQKLPSQPLEFPYIFHSLDKNITISKKKILHTSLLAFKGETILNDHIAVILQTFLNVNATLQWADSLKEIAVYPEDRNPSKITNLNTVHGQEQESTNTSPNKKKDWKEKLQFWKKKSKDGEFFSSTEAKTNSNGNDQQTIPFTDQFISNYLTTVPYLYQSIHNFQHLTPIVKDVMYQLYAMWPLPLRDFLFSRNFYLSDSDEEFIIYYYTIEDLARFPVKKHTVRTKSPFTIWKFQSLSSFCSSSSLDWYTKELSTETLQKFHEMKDQFIPINYCQQLQGNYENKTYLSLETFVLLEDIPIPWLINYIQSSWPMNTIVAFKKIIQKYHQQFHPRFQHWK